MNKKKVIQTGLFCLGSVLLILIDQYTKYWTIHSLKNTSGIIWIPGVFELQYVENRGAAFGILQQKRVFLILISLLVMAIIYFIYRRIPEEKRFLPFRIISVMLVSGALGNMIDRIFRGYVVDFLYFKYIDFPVFNIADCYVVISVIAAFFFICFYYKDEELNFLSLKNWRKSEKS